MKMILLLSVLLALSIGWILFERYNVSRAVMYNRNAIAEERKTIDDLGLIRKKHQSKVDKILYSEPGSENSDAYKRALAERDEIELRYKLEIADRREFNRIVLDSLLSNNVLWKELPESD